MKITDPANGGAEVFNWVPGADLDIRPLYPLIQKLERRWPVTVEEQK